MTFRTTSALGLIGTLFVVGVSSAQISDPSSNFGTLQDSNIGQSITAGQGMFSTPLPAPTLGDSGSTGSTGATGTAAGGDASATASSLMQNNAVNPFSAAAGTATTTGQTQRNSFRSGMGALNSLFGNGNGFNNAFGQQDQKRLPTKLTVKFQHPKLPSNQVGADISSRLERINMPRVAVSVADRVATLTGTVDSPESSRLAERFVLLEPGISQVENYLVVQESLNSP